MFSLYSPNDFILAGSEIHKTDRDNQNIKIVAVLIFCNAYVLLTMLECMYDKNTLQKHLKRCQCLKKMECGWMGVGLFVVPVQK